MSLVLIVSKLMTSTNEIVTVFVLTLTAKQPY